MVSSTKYIVVGIWGLIIYFLARKSYAAVGGGVEIDRSSFGWEDRSPPGSPPSVSRWEDTVRPIARTYGVKPVEVLAIIWQESNGASQAVGVAGEIGLMQVLPSTAAGYGFSATDLRDPVSNIKCGCAYFAYCVDKTYYFCDRFRAYNRGVAGAASDPQKGKSYAENIMNKLNGTSGVSYC